MKLYQSALKYHSEGPASYDKAATAYKELFDSDVFKYPESQSELRRQETYGESFDFDELLQHVESAAAPVVSTAADAAPNTLPQVLHLAYKNHGHFLLDALQNRVEAGAAHSDPAEIRSEIRAGTKVPLNYLAEALDKDDGDIDLWRSTASVARLVGSTRIERYCLEAVLDGDEDGLDGALRLPNIEEAFAAEKLGELVGNLQDDLSSTVAPSFAVKGKKLSQLWRKRLEVYPLLPKPKFEETTYSRINTFSKPPSRQIVTLPGRDWVAVGNAILSQLSLEADGDGDFGAALCFKISEETTSPTLATIPIRPSPKVAQLEFPATHDIPPKQDSPTKSQKADPEGENAIVDNSAEDEASIGIATAEEKEVQMEDAEVAQEDSDQAQDAVVEEPERVNTRKRSTASAELPETADGGRARSKRLRKRETLDGNTTLSGVDIDTTKNFETALQQYCDADDWLFGTIESIFEKIQVDALGSNQSLRSITAQVLSEAKASTEEEPLAVAVRDLFDICQNCTQEKSSLFTNDESIDQLASTPIEYSLASILGMKSDAQKSLDKPQLDLSEGVEAWLETANSKWVPTTVAAWKWLALFLKPNSYPNNASGQPSSYTTHVWPGDLKKTVVQVAVHADEHIYQYMATSITKLDTLAVNSACSKDGVVLTAEDKSIIEMAQIIFELHLDVFKRFKHPNSGIDGPALIAQQYRLERWSALANTAINLRTIEGDGFADDDLAIRHLWAVAFQISALDDVSQTHIIAVMHDLRSLFITLGSPIIKLQNNAVMPELSIAALDQELSEINMKGFFQKVFSHDEEDPVAVIESLEPILDLQHMLEFSQTRPLLTNGETSAAATPADDEQESIPSMSSTSPIQEVSMFLAKGSATLRLSLWQRLRMAYETIEHSPKVVSCHFRSIEMLTREFVSPTYLQESKEVRASFLLRWLRMIDELLQKIFKIQKSASDPFEYMDVEHLRSSLNALQTLSRLLYTFNIYEDYVRVGQIPAPVTDGRAKPAFLIVANKMYELQAKSWVLQYLLLKEAISQDPESFPAPTENRLEFLRAVHYALGIRGICNRADKALLKLERDELLELSDLEMSDFEMCQVLQDLYGLKLSPNPAELLDHRCDDVEPMTRGRAHKLLGFVIAQAGKVPIKDLPKTELKASIDKVHGFLGMARIKMTEDMQMNRRIVQQFLKSPVNPLDLFSAIKGVLELPVKPVPAKDAPVAAKGWHNLMANIALSKFRTQKRLQAGPTEDLNTAVSFFIQDLEFSTDQWETWYRLAQCYDLQLEECVSWTAEKINTQSQDVLQYQRSAVHCYAMAISAAIRNVEEVRENKTALAELFYEFGLRLYSSSREPFSLRAFQFRDLEERWFSGQEMYKRPPFRPLQLYTCWKIAARLFQESISRNPDNWLSHYMLGKCLWKMYSASESTRGSQKPPAMQKIIDTFCNAIEAVPERKSKEPILEPHYKLVSIIWKLVQRKDLDPSKGSSILQENTKYAQKANASSEIDTWSPFILNVIGELKSADKANWHHRMTARVSIYYLSLRLDLTSVRLRTSFTKIQMEICSVLWARGTNSRNKCSRRPCKSKFGARTTNGPAATSSTPVATCDSSCVCSSKSPIARTWSCSSADSGESRKSFTTTPNSGRKPSSYTSSSFDAAVERSPRAMKKTSSRRSTTKNSRKARLSWKRGVTPFNSQRRRSLF